MKPPTWLKWQLDTNTSPEVSAATVLTAADVEEFFDQAASSAEEDIAEIVAQCKKAS